MPRVAVLEAGQADEREVLTCPPGPLLPRHGLGLQPELDVGLGGAPGEQGVLLEDDPPVEPGAGDGGAVDDDLPCRRARQAGDQVQECGLAAAAGAHEREELARAHVEVHAGQRGERLAGVPDGEGLADVPDADFAHDPLPPA
jgi:hypothetical protein